MSGLSYSDAWSHFFSANLLIFFIKMHRIILKSCSSITSSIEKSQLFFDYRMSECPHGEKAVCPFVNVALYVIDLYATPLCPSFTHPTVYDQHIPFLIRLLIRFQLYSCFLKDKKAQRKHLNSCYLVNGSLSNFHLVPLTTTAFIFDTTTSGVYLAAVHSRDWYRWRQWV